MSEIKAILFDADGVLTLPEEMFSVVYTRSHGLDIEPFEKFFTTEWQDFVLGKRDLKDHIRNNPDLWKWGSTPDELLEYWFKSEDVRNEELIELIQMIRTRGIPCYLATEQERYRGNYMRDVMFKDIIDGCFVTAELGVKKSDPRFFEKIIEQLSRGSLQTRAKDVMFFDDSQSKVDAAVSAGINGVLFESVKQVKDILTSMGVLSLDAK